MPVYEFPLKIISVANRREHWAKRYRRAKAHRDAAIVIRWHPVPCVVRLTRIAPQLMDDDNITMGFKALRDGIADRLRVDDGCPDVHWEYYQELGKQYSCRVEILPY